MRWSFLCPASVGFAQRKSRARRLLLGGKNEKAAPRENSGRGFAGKGTMA
jgi:hypothetical protein